VGVLVRVCEQGWMGWSGGRVRFRGIPRSRALLGRLSRANCPSIGRSSTARVVCMFEKRFVISVVCNVFWPSLRVGQAGTSAGASVKRVSSHWRVWGQVASGWHGPRGLEGWATLPWSSGAQIMGVCQKSEPESKGWLQIARQNEGWSRAAKVPKARTAVWRAG